MIAAARIPTHTPIGVSSPVFTERLAVPLVSFGAVPPAVPLFGIGVIRSFPTDQEINSVTYTVLETDKDGNPVDDDTFKYTVTGQGEVTLNNDNRYTVTKEITNSLSSEPTPIPTATRLIGSCAIIASRIASEIESQTLSG